MLETLGKLQVRERNVVSGHHRALGKEEQVIVRIIRKAALHLLPGCHLQWRKMLAANKYFIFGNWFFGCFKLPSKTSGSWLSSIPAVLAGGQDTP